MLVLILSALMVVLCISWLVLRDTALGEAAALLCLLTTVGSAVILGGVGFGLI